MEFLDILAGAVGSAIGPFAAIYALAAIGLNMHFGYTGLLNFGQVGFMLVGGYGVAITVATFGMSMWLGLIMAVVCAVVLALLLGLPTLRLRADYLAIATVAAAEVARLLYRSSSVQGITGGVYGLQGFADPFFEVNPYPSGSYGFWLISFSRQEMWIVTVAWGVVLACSAVMWMLMHSPWGRVIKGIREDEEAVRSLGKNVFAYKMQSLVLGGVFGALAGVIMVLDQQTIHPDAFLPQITFMLWALLLLGGAGRTLGPILGGMLLWFLLSLFDGGLRQLARTDLVPFLESSDVGALRTAMVGLLLVLLIIFRPQGLIGDRKEMMVNVR